MLIPQAFKGKGKVQIQDLEEQEQQILKEDRKRKDDKRTEKEWYKYKKKNHPIPGIHTNELPSTESDPSDNSFGVESEYNKSTEE